MGSNFVRVDFRRIIDELVDFERKNLGYSLKDMAITLNLEDVYVRQLNAPSVDKHYTLDHLFILSRAWKIDINSFLPSAKTLRQLTAYKDYSDEQADNLITEMLLEMKGVK